jgi:hypothetical protein
MQNRLFEEYYTKTAASDVTGGSAPGTNPESDVTIEVDTTAVKRRISQIVMGNNVGVWIGKIWFENRHNITLSTLSLKTSGIHPRIHIPLIPMSLYILLHFLPVRQDL